MYSGYGAEEGFFTPKSSDSVREINGWVKEHTKDKIDSIVTENNLDEDALAVLINAIYFDGKWTEPFEAPARPGSFYTPHGLQEAQLMADRVKTYFEHGGFIGFSKPYKDGYEFIGILPDGLGLGSLFEPHALDGTLTDEALALGDTAWVGDVLHKTYMKMYEEGTEAAATTAVMFTYGATSINHREQRSVVLDRPFAFLIRDVDSGRVVFCGAVSSME